MCMHITLFILFLLFKFIYIFQEIPSILLKSTMKKQHQEKSHQSNCNQPISDGPIIMQYLISNQKNAYYSELMNLQNTLNMHLLVNTNLMNSYMAQHSSYFDKKNSQKVQTTQISNKNDHQQIMTKRPSIQQSSKNKLKKQKFLSYKKKQSDSEYEPIEDEHGLNTQNKIRQTKNIPKNYGKAILSYINKNRKYVESVLQVLDVSERKFFIYLENVKKKLNTIADLRALWMQDENPFAKPMRILSINYIRKHSLSHIFNSRVQNYGKHIKYRYKMIQALESPSQFTQMKDF